MHLYRFLQLLRFLHINSVAVHWLLLAAIHGCKLLAVIIPYSLVEGGLSREFGDA